MAQSFLSAFVVQGTAGIAHAQVPPVVTVAPTIDTNISIYKDGTVPFDTNTWTDASMGNSINDA